MQLMTFLHYSIKKDMLNTSQSKELKQYVIRFLKTLSMKIYEQPTLVNLLFTDSRKGTRKEAYLPMSILLLLLTKEEINEDEGLKLLLRETILF